MATRKGTKRQQAKAASADAQAQAPDDAASTARDKGTGDPSRKDAVRAHLGEAGAHVRAAARAAAETLGSAVSEASQAARAELGEGGARVRESLNEAGSAGKDAFHAGTSPELDKLLETGRDFTRSAEAMIRARPVAAFGAALAAGYLLARILRR